MRKNFGSKPWCYPQPVFILAAYDENGVPNAMNAAWGGIHYDDQIAMCISANHKTTANIIASKAFTVSMADVDHMVACDYVGIESGNKVPDKFARAGFTATKSEFVNAPVINELPMCIECRLVSYDPETCNLIGEIVNVSADERILDENRKIDASKLRPITFDPVRNDYLVIGEKVGDAFRSGLALK
ncbi:MAG: flavin reductase family protein [Muribaculaceae bacterium]|nr:flavin reductase family protein [Muribaculaceae bacterium]